jgi:hypothetical protein
VSSWRHLINRRTKIYTDHKPLETFLLSKTQDPLLLRWSLLLSTLPLEIVWIPGKSNQVADALSRTVRAMTNSLTPLEEETLLIQYFEKKIALEDLPTQLSRAVRRYTMEDSVLFFEGYPAYPAQERPEMILQNHLLLAHAKSGPLTDHISKTYR